MIPEFIDFCLELFPSIDPYTAEQAKRALEQFDGVSKPKLAIEQQNFDMLQGDFYSELPFCYYDNNGEQRIFLSKAELLSNTCDATRDDNLLFAAVRPISEFSGNADAIDAIKRNKRYSLFYVPDTPLDEYYIDFELITTIPREMVMKLCESGNVKRIASLTSVGYYMFISKLTIFLMRPEDLETNQNRN